MSGLPRQMYHRFKPKVAEAIQEFVAQHGATEIRVHLGVKEDGTPDCCLELVPLADMADQGAAVETTVLNESWPCPPLCS